jgi:hypothetical protein
MLSTSTTVAAEIARNLASADNDHREQRRGSHRAMDTVCLGLQDLLLVVAALIELV